MNVISKQQVRLDQAVLEQGADLPALASSLLRLFHNLRAALHVPDQPPSSLPPASGPGRNDAFGLLSAAFFGAPQPYAPVKYGLVWNVDHRRWVHWDGNTQSPLGRNLLAALGLGAPLLGRRGELDFAAVKRQTDLSESIRAPRYPFPIDREAASRGFAYFQANCASCHSGVESDARLYPVSDIGTEPNRARAFTQLQADRFNRFLARLQTAGYEPSAEPGIRTTQKYWAATLDGVWARSPYLHNGSVRTLRELLTPAEQRAASFRRGSIKYDEAAMGYADEGSYVLDTQAAGNSNAGHNYGTRLTAPQQQDLIEYLKTL
ncbi:MAG: c-type cytochrome [Verrucomicrobiota bacterium]